MPEGLVLPNGKPAGVVNSPENVADASFAEAMAQPVQDVPEPPDRPEKSEPKQRRPRAPRAQKESAPSPKPSGKGAPAGPVKSDYTDDAAKLVQATWTIMASVGPTQPYALPVAGNADAWVSGLAEGAKHNAMIRRLVEGTGESSWMLTLAAAGMSTSMQMYQIMRDPKLRAEAAETTKAQLRHVMKAQGVDLLDDVSRETKPEPQGADVQPG